MPTIDPSSEEARSEEHELVDDGKAVGVAERGVQYRSRYQPRLTY